jgi:PPOX class probable F420-dependent enzyme
MATNFSLPATAQQRLRTEADARLTTVRSDGQPQSSVIWFWWDDGIMWIRSQPRTAKIANIRHNARVSVTLNSDGRGEDVVTFEGRAELVDDLPDDVRAAYVEKYGRTIRTDQRITPEQMLADYSATIRIVVERARVW